MLKINTNIVGIGKKGVDAVNAMCNSKLSGFKKITLSCEEDSFNSQADFVFTSKSEFSENKSSFFLSPTTLVFVLTDVSSDIEVSLSAEIASIAIRHGAFPVAVAFMPSSRDELFENSLENLKDLHDIFSGVVRFNEGYVDNFPNECESFFKTLSFSMSLNASNPLKSFDEIKEMFSSDTDIHFASVTTKEKYDSHLFNSKCMCLKLCAQMGLDEARLITYFYASGGETSDEIINSYRAPIEKINLGYLSNRITYISENAIELKDDEHIFSVMCAK
jgi:hypothetical protein